MASTGWAAGPQRRVVASCVGEGSVCGLCPDCAPPPLPTPPILPTADSVHQALLSLLEKAGYEVVYPAGLHSTCCGMMFSSRGFKEVGGWVDGWVGGSTASSRGVRGWVASHPSCSMPLGLWQRLRGCSAVPLVKCKV